MRDQESAATAAQTESVLYFTIAYLIKLFISPQLWVPGLVGFPADKVLLPLWLVSRFFVNRARYLFSLPLQDRLFLAWVLWIFVTSFVNDSNALTTTYLVNYSMWFVLFKLIKSSVITLRELRVVCFWLVLIVMVLVAEGIQHFHAPDGRGWAGQPMGWALAESGRSGRLQWIGIFDGPGVFAVVYTTALPFVLRYLAPPYPKTWRLIALPMAAALFLAIYYTGSRGGFLATLAILGLYLAYWLKISLSRLLLIGGILLGLVAVAPSFLVSTHDSSRSAQHRVEVWADGVDMTIANPVFGIGRGNYSNYTGTLIAHNSAIEAMGETGLPGLMLWLLLIYTSFKHLYLYHQQTDSLQEKSLVAALGISIAGYIVSSMFVTLEYETFYMLLALAGTTGWSLKQPLRLQPRELFLIGGAVLGWLMVVKIFVMLYFR